MSPIKFVLITVLINSFLEWYFKFKEVKCIRFLGFDIRRLSVLISITIFIFLVHLLPMREYDIKNSRNSQNNTNSIVGEQIILEGIDLDENSLRLRDSLNTFNNYLLLVTYEREGIESGGLVHFKKNIIGNMKLERIYNLDEKKDRLEAKYMAFDNEYFANYEILAGYSDEDFEVKMHFNNHPTTRYVTSGYYLLATRKIEGFDIFLSWFTFLLLVWLVTYLERPQTKFFRKDASKKIISNDGL